MTQKRCAVVSPFNRRSLWSLNKVLTVLSINRWSLGLNLGLNTWYWWPGLDQNCMVNDPTSGSGRVWLGQKIYKNIRVISGREVAEEVRRSGGVVAGVSVAKTLTFSPQHYYILNSLAGLWFLPLCIGFGSGRVGSRWSWVGSGPKNWTCMLLWPWQYTCYPQAHKNA